MRVLIFDTETTGLPKTKILSSKTLNLWPYIVQFSYIIFETDTCKIIKKSDSIVKLKPYNVISDESVKLHGITNEISLLKGQPIASILKQYFDDIQTVDLIVAHNINFDSSMIKIELLRLISQSVADEKLVFNNYLNVISDASNLYCSMQESIEICNIEVKDKNGKPYLKFPKLIELYIKLFNETPINLHNSFNDVLVTLRCFMKLKFNKDIIDMNAELINEFRKIN